MAVEINIDLDSAKAHGKIEALETRLRAVGDKTNIDFDIDGDLKDSIQQITNELKEINIDVDYDDLERAAALKSMLQGDIETDLDVDSDKALREIQEGLDPPDGGGDEGGGGRSKFVNQKREARFTRALERFSKYTDRTRKPGGDFAPADYRRKFVDKHRPQPRLDAFSKRLDNIGKQPRDKDGQFLSSSYFKDFLNRHRSRSIGPTTSLRGIDSDRLGRFQTSIGARMDSETTGVRRFQTDLDVGDFRRFTPPFGGRDNYLSSPRDGKVLDGLKERLRRVIPDMNTFYNILAALIPILVVFITQALGVAAAMGAVALAGASIVGLGLIGHGDDMADSFGNAKDQLKDLAEEMFNVFQPTMQTFAPIQERFFDSMPGMLDEVASSMENLTVYSDSLFQMMRGLSGWIANGFQGMADMEEIISQLAMRFGGILGDNINRFFRFIVEEGYAAQSMLIKVGAAFRDIMTAAYGIFKALVAVLTALSPLIGVLQVVEKLLNNKLAVGIMTFLAVAGVAIYTVLALSNAFIALSTVSITSVIPAILSLHGTLTMYIHQALATVMANHALASSIATVISVATLGTAAILGLYSALSAVNGMNAVADVKHQMNGGGGLPTGGGNYGGGAGSGTTQKIINQGDTYNMEVHGNVDNATEQGLRDIVASEGSVHESRQPPDVGGS